MIRKLVAALSITVFVLTASAGKSTQRRNPIAHPCCYCACQMKDYHHDCHKLCQLPKGDNGRVRVLTGTENKMCQHLCAFKKEGTEHLKH